MLLKDLGTSSSANDQFNSLTTQSKLQPALKEHAFHKCHKLSQKHHKAMLYGAFDKCPLTPRRPSLAKNQLEDAMQPMQEPYCITTLGFMLE